MIDSLDFYSYATKDNELALVAYGRGRSAIFTVHYYAFNNPPLNYMLSFSFINGSKWQLRNLLKKKYSYPKVIGPVSSYTDFTKDVLYDKFVGDLYE